MARALLQQGGMALLTLLGKAPGRHFIGACIGRAALLVGYRRRVAQVNLSLAFPDMPPRRRARIARQHFIALGEWMMDSLWGLSATRAQVRRYIKIEGDAPPPGSILFVPHFIGLDIVLLRLSDYFANLSENLSDNAGNDGDNAPAAPPVGFYYKPMHSAFWNRFFLHLRRRFGSVGFSTLGKAATLRAAVRHCRAGGALCYLPDMNPHDPKGTVYVPFLSVKDAATTTGLSRLAKIAKAPVVPTLICRGYIRNDDTGGGGGARRGYVVKFLPPMSGFPGDNAAADATRMNELIAEWIAKMPENYYWLHRRFKRNEKGDTGVYD